MRVSFIFFQNLDKVKRQKWRISTRLRTVWGLSGCLLMPKSPIKSWIRREERLLSYFIRLNFLLIDIIRGVRRRLLGFVHRQWRIGCVRCPSSPSPCPSSRSWSQHSSTGTNLLKISRVSFWDMSMPDQLLRKRLRKIIWLRLICSSLCNRQRGKTLWKT